MQSYLLRSWRNQAINEKTVFYSSSVEHCTQTIGLSHFDCFYVVHEVPTPLSDHFERYFNIVDGQTEAIA